MLKAEIKYLTLEEGINVFEQFKLINFHQYQDPLRSVFVKQPCFICRTNDAIVAFAVIEKHKFRKASIWLGPIIKPNFDKNLIWKEFYKELKKSNIAHLTLQCENLEDYQSAYTFLSKDSSAKLIRKQFGMSTAIKKLEGTETTIFESYSKHHQKEVQISQKKNIVLKHVETEEDFEKLVQLFLLMFQQKKIHHYPADLRKRLQGEYNYIKFSGNGRLVLAEYDGSTIGASIELFTKDSSFYVFGATDKRSKLPVSYKILHNAFISNLQIGINYFDFGGYQQDELDLQFAKVSKFKGGFGVETKKYPDRLIINTGGIQGVIIEKLIVVRNLILKLIGRHVS